MDRIVIQPETPGAEAPEASVTSTQVESVQITQSQSEPPQRPDHIPEKFWKDGKVDVDALAKSYGELEKKSSTPKQEAPKDEPAKQDKPAGDKPQDKTPDQLAKDDAFKPFVEEFAKDGQLSEDSFKALEAKGLSRELVESYIAGQKAQQQLNSANAEAETARILDSVGGADNYAQMAEWAANNLPVAEIKAYDEIINSGDAARISLAVSGLHAKYVKSEGSPANLVRGGAGQGVKAFRSTAEVTAAMNDPRYKNDPAYRDEVMQRIGVSDVL